MYTSHPLWLCETKYLRLPPLVLFSHVILMILIPHEIRHLTLLNYLNHLWGLEVLLHLMIAKEIWPTLVST